MKTPTFPYQEDGSCEDGRRQAQADASAGILRYVTYGDLANPYLSGDFYGNFLQARYGIEMVQWGCLVNRFIVCYAEEMEKIITKKYGKQLYEEEYIEAEYIKFRALNKADKKSYIDFNHIYFRVDERAVCPYDLKEFCEEALKKLDLRLLPPDFDDDKIEMDLVVDEQGRVVDYEETPELPADFAEMVLSELQRKGAWKPGELYGYKVKSWYWLSFPLNGE